MDSFTLVIFGITGNLSQIKLIPTLYDLVAAGAIDCPFSVVGVGRADLDETAFRTFVSEALHSPNSHHEHGIDAAVETKLLSLMQYVRLDFGTDSNFTALKHAIDKLPTSKNKMFYLATYPHLYTNIFTSLEKSGLNAQKSGWVRILLEKPMGHNLASAHELNELLARYYIEDQIFRLDHYLGKETMQNILTFRFGNELFEPLMNKEYIDHIQVTAAEDFGIGQRGGFYERAGALRDVGQNHVLQMLALATMERPSTFTNTDITRERVKLLATLRPDPGKIVFGQYDHYHEEQNVNIKSDTETFFALETYIDNDRYRNVPIFIRAGKYLASTVAEVSIVFKNTEHRLLKDLPAGENPNVLIYRIQPNEGIVLKMLTKVPGYDLKLQESYMQYCYRLTSPTLPGAYERLLIDALRGDQTFFNDAPEVEAQWRFIDPLEVKKKDLHLHLYPQGTWGPEAANKLIARSARSWLEPSMLFCAL
jgi:glucose-6-phosphate 1-dehydrogenase